MDAVPLVDDRIEDGTRLLGRLRDAEFVVRAACWVKPVEDDRWSLYIVAPAVDKVGAVAAYRQVFHVLRSAKEEWVTWVSDSEIKLIGVNHPVAKDLFEVASRFPGRVLPRSQFPFFGGVPVEEVYVYPSINGMTVTIYGMVFRGSPGNTLHLSLEPHNPNSQLTVESAGRPVTYPAETGLDWTVVAPEGATLQSDLVRGTVLAWDINGQRRTSSANEVWTFAKLGLHGFRFLSEPAKREAVAAEF